jgi:hypothetical protein
VRILEKVGMRREQHGIGDSWHAELGWLDGYTYAALAGTWRRGPSPDVAHLQRVTGTSADVAGGA